MQLEARKVKCYLDLCGEQLFVEMDIFLLMVQVLPFAHLEREYVALEPCADRVKFVNMLWVLAFTNNVLDQKIRLVVQSADIALNNFP